MPSFNDVLVVIFIPLMEYVVYPHIEKTMNVKIRPLHKVREPLHNYKTYYLLDI